MNTNYKVIGLTRLGIEPKSTAPEADALTARPSELFKVGETLVNKIGHSNVKSSTNEEMPHKLQLSCFLNNF